MTTPMLSPADRFRNDVYTDTDDTRANHLDDLRKLFEEDLTPQRAQAMVAELGPEPMEEMLRDMAQPSGFFGGKGGWSADERAGFYKVLAGKLDGLQMAGLLLSSLDKGILSFDDAKAIGAAMGALPPGRNEDKLLFVGGMARYAAQPDVIAQSEDGFFSASTHLRYNAKGAAIAECVLGLKDSPQALDEAFRLLGPGGVANTLVGGLGIHQTTSVSRPFLSGCNSPPVPKVETTFDPHAASRLIEMAKGGDLRTRCWMMLSGEGLPIASILAHDPNAKLGDEVDVAMGHLRLTMPPDTPCTMFQKGPDL